jgi:hypothetical protein
MKTNFDVWRDQLTPEEVAMKLDASNLVCDFCPARHECDGTYCKDHFLRWADAPAKEEE